MGIILLLTLGGACASSLLLLRLSRKSRQPIPPPNVKITKVTVVNDPDRAKKSIRRGRLTGSIYNAHKEAKRLKREVLEELNASED